MGMFDGGVGMFGASSFVGGNGGFVGARPGGMTAQQYYAMEAARQEQQREENLKRRLMRQEQGNTDRELSLKEQLANHQMAQDRESTGLARDRLGLDANTASNDANQRANALSLQERLGWAGENRLANSDQQQNERANQQLSLQERLGMMSEGRLARGQDQDEAFRRAQLGQQAQLAQMPYQQQTADSAAQSQFQNRQLGQQDKQFNRQFTDMPLADRWRNSLAEKQQSLDQSNTDRAFNDLSARDRQTGQLEDKRMGMTERLAGNENQLRRDLQGETLKQQLQMWSGLSAAEKQQNKQFGQKLAQDVYEFKNVSGNNRFTIDAQRGMHDDNILAGDRRAGLDWMSGVEDRALREKMGKESNETQKLGYLSQLLERSGMQVDPDTSESMLQKLLGGMGVQNSPIADPQERSERNMIQQMTAGVTKQVLGRDGPPSTPEELQRVNQAVSKTLYEAKQSGFFSDATLENVMPKVDAVRVTGAPTVQELLRKAKERSDELNRRPRIPIGVAPPDSNWPGRFGGY